MPAMALAAADLPLTESFDDGLGEFKTEDANKDGVTIKTLPYYGYNYTDGLQYVASPENDADDWLFTPELSLRKGYVYELTFQYKVTSSGTSNEIEWKAGPSAEASAMNVDVAASREYTYNFGSWKKESVKVTVPEDGIYVLGMHIVSAAAQGTIYIDSLEIGEGVNGKAPLAPSVSTPVFTVEGESLIASFNITLPSSDVSGGNLNAENVDVLVRRSDSEDVTTVSGKPGEVVSYIDRDASDSRVTYTFSCMAAGAESSAVEMVSSPFMGTPKPVSGLDVTQNGNEFEISWEAVTEAENETALFIPSKVRYTVKCGTDVVADAVTDLNASYVYPMPENGQDAVAFSVVASAGSMLSSAVKSRAFMVGEPYAGEFHESFASRSYTNKTWVVEDDRNTAWSPTVGNSYSPVVDPQDNDGGCLKFYYSSEGDLSIWSPMMDISMLENPRLSFWVFLQPNSYYVTMMQPAFYVDGEVIEAGEPVCIKAGAEEGWAQFVIDVPEKAAANPSQIMFIGKGGTYGSMYIDNVSVRGYLACDIAAEAAAPTRPVAVGAEVMIPVTVANKGVNAANGYKLRLSAGEEELAVVEGVEILPMDEAVIDVPFKALPRYADMEVELSVTADYEADMDPGNNVAAVKVEVAGNDLELPQSLTAEADKTTKTISLAWEEPAISTETVYTEMNESFESWTPGGIEGESGWMFIDVDEVTQSGVNNVNQGRMFAAMVTEGFTAKNSWDPSLECFDGSYCLAITPAVSSYNTDIDNWVISPDVKGGTELSFHTMTFSAYGNGEQYDILWSEGGTSPEDFTLLTTVTSPLNKWTQQSVELPQDAKRFAIHMHGRHSNPVMFDSFLFTAESEPAMFMGYNLYRDHMLLATLPSDAISYVDENPELGRSHSYRLTALYDKGESCYGNEAVAMIENPAAVEGLYMDSDSDKVEYYTPDGVRVSSPEGHGIVIVRKGNSTYKQVTR